VAESDRLSVVYPAGSGEVIAFAAGELARSLSAMLPGLAPVGLVAEPATSPTGTPRLRVERGGRFGALPVPPAAAGPAQAGLTLGGPSDSFALRREAIARPGARGVLGERGAMVLEGGTEGAVLHAVYYLLERLGAQFPLMGAARLPVIGGGDLERIENTAIEPAFARRAFAADIMTWHYDQPDWFDLHLQHDRAFVPWMAARGMNAFFYIRHAHDSRLKIDELLPLYRERGIASEYGGHVLQLLLPRERFDDDPALFPASAAGVRKRNGNLCVSSEAAIAAVCEGAVRYARENPECELLHVWGADVRQGAWCQFGACAGLSAQQQYMNVVNAIAGAFETAGSGECPVAYLAYHDTLEPDAGLRPAPNVHFEWAPRERCYSHSIDDPACAANPRYYESLKRYIELFDGRGQVFEYYADAILFGGLGFATPAVIAGDLRAYHALGIKSISCLSFGAYSALAYPVNLEAFTRGTRSPGFDPDRMIADTAAQLHPRCAPAMAEAYRAIAQASATILENGGDVLRPRPGRGLAGLSSGRREQLFAQLERASAAAEQVFASSAGAMAAGERGVWQYSRKVVGGITAYLAAIEDGGSDRMRRGEAAIKSVAEAVSAIHGIEPGLKGSWGACDIERVRAIGLEAMRRRLAGDEGPSDRPEKPF